MHAEDSVSAVDMSFALAGEALPADHAHALWLALHASLPWLAEAPGAGVHPLRGATTADGQLLLARRTRLVLRLPERRIDAARHLEGATLTVAGHRLRLGEARLRALAPASTLHARLVASEARDEAGFSAEITAILARLGITCRFICGKRHALIASQRRVGGHSVVLHDIPVAVSRRLQQIGLGPDRHLGCGVLVPHKTIGGLE